MPNRSHIHYADLRQFIFQVLTVSGVPDHVAEIEAQIEKNHKDQYQSILLIAFCLLILEYGMPSRNKTNPQWKRWEE